MSRAKSYRVRESDGLPKLMPARAWVDLVTRERPPRPVLAGVIAMDIGEGVEPCLLGWDGRTAIAAPLARLSGRVAAIFAAEGETIRQWQSNARGGAYSAAMARARAA